MSETPAAAPDAASDRPDPDAAAVPGAATEPAAEPAPRVITPFGVAGAVLGLLALAAVILGALLWSGHARAEADRAYQGRALAVATDWVGMLANIDIDNVDATLARLHEGTVGELNTEFEAAVRPYRDVVRQLKSRSTGAVDAVAIESVRRDDTGRPRPAAALPPELAGRIDTVLVVATSVADNTAGESQTVRWLLRLDIADVEGVPMVSGLEFLR